MMDSADARMQAMRTRLEAAFDPRELTIQDDSHKHVGHAGAATGKGHFTVRIRAQAFADMALLARHRAIYAALGDLMDTDIHALAIDVDV